MVQLNDTPIQWLADWLSIINGYDRLFMSQVAFNMIFYGSLHSIHLSETFIHIAIDIYCSCISLLFYCSGQHLKMHKTKSGTWGAYGSNQAHIKLVQIKYISALKPSQFLFMPERAALSQRILRCTDVFLWISRSFTAQQWLLHLTGLQRTNLSTSKI